MGASKHESDRLLVVDANTNSDPALKSALAAKFNVADSLRPNLTHPRLSEILPNRHNRLINGDCLDVMKALPDSCVDLIYVDPPFSTGREHVGTTKATGRAPTFSDSWNGGLDEFVGWLTVRLQEMHRLLAKTGGIYVHLDWRASHYVKCAMDKIFGYDNFRNEICWRRDVAGKGAKKNSTQWPRNADTILVYSRSSQWNFRQQFRELTTEQRANYRYQEPDGRRFRTVQLGDYSAASIERMDREGLIYKSKTGKKYKKYYLDEAKSTIDCIWTDIHGFGTRTAASEWVGYPTQKPLALLDRIIESSSKPGDVIADFFCGSGTTCVSATLMNRRWIGVDQSNEAIQIAKLRLIDALDKVVHGAGKEKTGGADTLVVDAKQRGLFGFKSSKTRQAREEDIEVDSLTWYAGFDVENFVS